MRMSELFVATLREPPAEVDGRGHAALLRAGYVRRLHAGGYDYLPLGLRVRRRVEAVVRAEMEALGAQEVALPLVQPAELWQRSGRLDAIDADLVRFDDRAGRALVLAMTHEEAATELAAAVLRSYRQLPFALFQIQTKFRDEARARGGLVRLREFTMKDAYSFHRDEDDFHAFYERTLASYRRLFARLGLEVLVVESDGGIMGGSLAHEFMVESEVGEDTLLLCGRCGYRANRQVARFARTPAAPEAARPVAEVHTPGASTIAALCERLGVGAERTAKAVFLVARLDEGERFVLAVLRGDTELSETKLAALLGAHGLRPATPDEVRAVGAEPGYGSPVGLRPGVEATVVADEAALAPNLVAGANREGWHLRDVNHGRDWRADRVADLAAASDGDACLRCGGPLEAVRGVEVGNTFALGTRFAEALGAAYADADGARHPPVMGSYGIGIDRALAVVAEMHADEAGLAWPPAVAPYAVALLPLAGAGADAAVAEAAERLARQLGNAGVEVLLDDRDERPGVKFHDADLLGLPLRLSLGARSLARGVVETRLRRTGERGELPLDSVVDGVRALLDGDDDTACADPADDPAP